MRPAKKRDKERPPSSNGLNSHASSNNAVTTTTVMNGEQQMRSIGQQQEQELFLQAFEKPTQIYRFLRNRHGTNAIFLYRSLNYMKDRFSRSHKNRASFKVDNILKTVKEKLEAGTSNFVNVAYHGIFDKICQPDKWYSCGVDVVIEATLGKITKSKRKDRTSDIQEITHYHSSTTFNPDSTKNEYTAISIPVHLLQPLGDQHTSYKLTFIIRIPLKRITMDKCNGENISADATHTKENHIRCYKCELIIFEKSAGFIRTASYEVVLHELPHNGNKSLSPKKRTWEGLSDSYNQVNKKVNTFEKHLTLKFHVGWSVNEIPSTVKSAEMCKYGFLDFKHNSTASNDAQENAQINYNNNCIKYNTNNTKSRMEDVRIVYNFLYSNNTRQQTEYTNQLKCPWCGLDCFRVPSLVKHLKLCHARFSFTFQPVSNGARIDVTINDAYDGSYAGSPYDLAGSSGGSFARTCGPVRRTAMTDILVIRTRRQKHVIDDLVMDEDDLSNPRPYITGHNRLYHHTATCLPIHPKELNFDSEDEIDPQWLRQKTKQMIDEFSDVNEGEKEIMKMWNLHVMKYGFVGACQMPLACDMFVETHGEEIFRKNLYRNYVLHLLNFFDFSIITPEQFSKNLQKLKGILSKYPEGQQKIAAQRKQQLKFWLELGRHKEEVQKQKSPQKTTKLSPISNAESSSCSLSSSYAADDLKSNASSESDSGYEDYKQKSSIAALKRASSMLPNAYREKLERFKNIMNVAKKTATQKEMKSAMKRPHSGDSKDSDTATVAINGKQDGSMSNADLPTSTQTMRELPNKPKRKSNGLPDNNSKCSDKNLGRIGHSNGGNVPPKRNSNSSGSSYYNNHSALRRLALRRFEKPTSSRKNMTARDNKNSAAAAGSIASGTLAGNSSTLPKRDYKRRATDTSLSSAVTIISKRRCIRKTEHILRSSSYICHKQKTNKRNI